MTEPIDRCPVKCPNCGGSDIVAGDPRGHACDGCGHRARLRDFRRAAAKPLDAPLSIEEEAEMAAFLDRYKTR